MISFITIGRNEGWKLTKCIESIYRTVELNNLNDYEIIYVDSNSSDDSIERVIEFEDVEIFKITGKANAAIGRNIGARESTGGTLFFVDGDMEIEPEFLSLIYTEKEGLKYPFVSGQFIEHYYDSAGNFVGKRPYYSIRNDEEYDVTNGGLFCIERDLWFSVGGMKTKYKRSQDLDLALRLAKKGIRLLRKTEVMARHHTTHYRDKNRIFRIFPNGYDLYSRSVLYRDHILNKAIFIKLIRSDYTLIIFVLMAVCSFVLNGLLPFSMYVLVICLKSIKTYHKMGNSIFSMTCYYISRDLTVLFGFLFFFPLDIRAEESGYIRVT